MKCLRSKKRMNAADSTTTTTLSLSQTDTDTDTYKHTHLQNYLDLETLLVGTSTEDAKSVTSSGYPR